MNKIDLTFRATECNGWPKLKFYIDLDLIEDYSFTSPEAKITIPIDLVEGKHTLIIELYGKTSQNTIIDNGNIIQDQTVELIDMYADDILLPNFHKWAGEYRFNDQVHPQSCLWACNGEWLWDMEIPLISWLLDRKIEQDEKYNKPEITYNEMSKVAQKKIQILENELKRLDDV